MKCFNCGSEKTKTIYPKHGSTQFVQKKCFVCGWKSYPVEIKKVIKKLENETPKKKNIFDIFEELL
jgi:hypothetical protein